jgi:exosome complex RNA-binding protein Rrp42 (RNase PH superfamily)
MLAFWDENTRPDGRMFSQARQTKVVASLLKHSAGSALVKHGDTKVLAAMTIQIGQPAPEIPDHGDVLVTVSTSDQQRLDTLQSWLQRMLDDLLPPKLNLMTGKACIRLVVTVLILQDSGNLMDAALLACMAAWKDTTLPTMEHLKEEQGKLYWKENPTSSLDDGLSRNDRKDYRISLSMGVITSQKGDAKFLVDPTAEESKFTEGFLTMVVTLSNRTLQLEYSGAIALSATDLALAAKMANGRADELVKLL